MNFLESLAAEWYGYKGYFVRSNIRVEKLVRGGYGAELDVLAYSPMKGELLHIETSSDADSWSVRKDRLLKKFRFSHEQYEKLFSVRIDKVRKIAVCGFSFNSRSLKLGDIELRSVREFLCEISEELSHKDLMREAVPESYPLLRAIQMSTWAMKKSDKERR